MENITRRKFVNDALKATVVTSVALPLLFDPSKSMAKSNLMALQFS